MLVFGRFKTMQFSKIKFKHVCFDKDGTLVDVHATWVPITYRRAQKIIQYLELSEKYFAGLCRAMGVDVSLDLIISGGPVGYKPRVKIIDSTIQWLAQQKITASHKDLAEIFRGIDVEFQKRDDVFPKVLPGVVEGIKELKQRDVKISIFTSDRNKNTEKVLSMLDLSKDVDVIVGGDDVRSPKPDPEGFLTACSRAGVEPGDSVYVGDTVEDMQMARAGGCAGCFGLAQGLSSKEELAQTSDFVFTSFPELVQSFLKKKNDKKTASTI